LREFVGFNNGVVCPRGCCAAKPFEEYPLAFGGKSPIAIEDRSGLDGEEISWAVVHFCSFSSTARVRNVAFIEVLI